MNIVVRIQDQERLEMRIWKRDRMRMERKEQLWIVALRKRMAAGSSSSGKRWEKLVSLAIKWESNGSQPVGQVQVVKCLGSQKGLGSMEECRRHLFLGKELSRRNQVA